MITVTATSVTPTGIGHTEATLNASVTGLYAYLWATERGFEWGTTPGVYTDNWHEHGTYDAPCSWSHTVSGLIPGETYYFRAYVTVDLTAFQVGSTYEELHVQLSKKGKTTIANWDGAATVRGIMNRLHYAAYSDLDGVWVGSFTQTQDSPRKYQCRDSAYIGHVGVGGTDNNYLTISCDYVEFYAGDVLGIFIDDGVGGQIYQLGWGTPSGDSYGISGNECDPAPGSPETYTLLNGGISIQGKGVGGDSFYGSEISFSSLAVIPEVDPDGCCPGVHLPIVSITGSSFTGATAVSFGAGVTVNSFTVLNDTEIQADITVSASAALGARTVTVTTPTITATAENGFTVLDCPSGGGGGGSGGGGWYGSAYGTAGNYLGTITGWKRLKIIRRVNSPDKIELVLDGRHEAVSILATDAIVQFYRQNLPLGIEPYKEAEGFCRDILHDWDQKAQYEYRAIFAGYEDLLDTRVLLGGDDEKYATSGYPAETVMKKVVEVQTGLTGARNIITNPIQGLVIEHSLGRGQVYIGYNMGQRLLAYLQDIADAKNMAFRVILDSDPGTFKFKAYPSPYGADRTATSVVAGRNKYGNIPVVFSEQRRNVETIGYHLLRDGEGNVAIDRQNNLVVIGPGESDSPWNHREFCLSVGPDDDPNAVADRDMAKMVAREEAAVQVMQTPQCCYGRHYFLGDWVTVYIAAPGLEKTITKAITEVTITVERRQGQMDESIDVVLSDRPVTFKDPLQESVINLSGRVGNVERRIA